MSSLKDVQSRVFKSPDYGSPLLILELRGSGDPIRMFCLKWHTSDLRLQHVKPKKRKERKESSTYVEKNQTGKEYQAVLLCFSMILQPLQIFLLQDG